MLFLLFSGLKKINKTTTKYKIKAVEQTKIAIFK